MGGWLSWGIEVLHMVNGMILGQRSSMMKPEGALLTKGGDAKLGSEIGQRGKI